MNSNSLFTLLSVFLSLTLLGGSLPAQPYAQGVVVTPLLKTTTTAAGQPIVYPTNGRPEVSALLVDIPAGAKTGWHKHPVPCYAYIVSGAVTVELEDGTTHAYKAGEAIAEVVDLLHNGMNHGTETAKLVLFVLGTEGAPFTVKSAPPAGR